MPGRITIEIEILDSDFKNPDLDGLAEAIRYDLGISLKQGNVFGYIDPDGKHQNWYVPAIHFVVTAKE